MASIFRFVLAISLAICTLFNVPVRAAGFPERSVRLVLPYAPGGALDARARLIAKNLSEKWGHPVLVENRPGGDSAIAEEYVAHATPDGYTLLFETSSLAIPTATTNKRSYDPLTSFAPISELGAATMVLLINPKTLPVRSLSELVALAKAKPGQLNFGSAGESSGGYLTVAVLMKSAGISMTNVSYKGMGPAVTALLGGEVQVAFASLIDGLENVHAGKLIALAVNTPQRSPAMPDVPTVTEATNLPYDATLWEGVLAPAGTHRDIVAKLHDGFVAAEQSPDIKERLAGQGYVTIASTPEEFDRTIKNDVVKWASLLNVNLSR